MNVTLATLMILALFGIFFLPRSSKNAVAELVKFGGAIFGLLVLVIGSMMSTKARVTS